MSEASRIVDVGSKGVTEREAVAEAFIHLSPAGCAKLLEGTPKGDPLEAARVAGLLAAKRTPELLPFCHPVRITAAELTLEPDASAGAIRVNARVRASDRTGVEMEALTAATVAALCLYDTAKAYDRAARIDAVRLLEKRGGKSGEYRAEDRRPATPGSGP
jgi:cyclic pyranopterin phosphate synthase